MVPGPASRPTEEDAKTSLKITDFFSKAPAPGRPRKEKNGGSRPVSEPPLSIVTAEEEPTNSGATKGASRTNWPTGDNLRNLEAAMAERKEKRGRCTAGMTIREFAAAVGIPKGTLSNYVTSSEKKRTLGSSAGRLFSVSQRRRRRRYHEPHICVSHDDVRR